MTILVSGLINIEITLKVEKFPVAYSPVQYPFGGVNSSVSGVGFNIAKALKVLGDEVAFLSMTGKDAARTMTLDALSTNGISDRYITEQLEETPHSVILYNDAGKRQINVDLKDIQTQKYPVELFNEALKASSMAVMCNINFSRPMLSKARMAGKPIATDVHAIELLEDEYNRDFMATANILFQSHEKLQTNPEDWAWQLFQRYGTEIVVVGMGAEGVMLGVRKDNFKERIPAVKTRPVVNTIGAGDALFSAFVHYYNQTHDPYESINKAIVFASYKIGDKGAADGFLHESSLETLYAEVMGG